MSVSMDVIGSYQHVLAFLQELQSGTQRLFLVAGLAGTARVPAAAGSGLPATNLGDVDLVVTGSLYVLVDSNAATVVVPAPSDVVPVPLPIPDANKNPLLPLG